MEQNPKIMPIKQVEQPGESNGQIVLVPIDRIKILPGNSKHHPAHQIEQLKSNIDKYGCTQPLLLTSRMELVAGHGRLEAMRALDWVHIPCLVKDLTNAEARALRIADNRIAELGEVNNQAIAMELADLAVDDFDLSGLGFSTEELDNILGVDDDMWDDAEPEQEPEKPKAKKSKPKKEKVVVVEGESKVDIPDEIFQDDDENPLYSKICELLSRAEIEATPEKSERLMGLLTAEFPGLVDG